MRGSRKFLFQVGDFYSGRQCYFVMAGIQLFAVRFLHALANFGPSFCDTIWVNIG